MKPSTPTLPLLKVNRLGFSGWVSASLAISVCAISAGCFSRARHESEASPETSARLPRRVEDAANTPESRVPGALSVDEQRELLRLARASLTSAVSGGSRLRVPTGLSGPLVARKGSFVTLTIAGQLRGCIGNIFPDKPLAEAVIDNAFAAALYDSRFTPVTPSELASIAIEVSVLTVPAALDFSSPDELLRKLRPHIDGVVLKVGTHRATFLPQVWEKVADATEFLGELSLKAGAPREAWKSEEARVQTYQVQAFNEP